MGMKLTEEHKKKIAERSRAYYEDPENRRKQSELIAKWWKERKENAEQR